MFGTFQVTPGLSGGVLGLLIAVCLITLVLVVLVAIWMYRDAQSRRMDGTVWVVLLVLASVFGGLLGLVIVTVIYLVVRGNPVSRLRESDDLVPAIPAMVLPPLRAISVRLRASGTRAWPGARRLRKSATDK